MRIEAYFDKRFDGKSLYKRVHGSQFEVVAGVNNLLFTLGYPHAKITGVEFFGGELLDKCDFYILDTETGAYTGVPNYVLNQFGFAANIGKDYYVHSSMFDADLYLGMQIKVVYTSVSAKTIGINYLLDEAK